MVASVRRDEEGQVVRTDEHEGRGRDDSANAQPARESADGDQHSHEKDEGNEPSPEQQ